MKLEEALKTNKKVKRSHWASDYVQYFLPGTGPRAGLVTCDYFVINEVDEPMFSTSLDLYPEDIFADDWEVAD